MDWQEGVRENYKVLDQIDFLPQLKAGTKVEDIMDWAEETQTVWIPAEWEGFLFSYIDEEEFATYLSKRYSNLNIQEIEVYHRYFLITDNKEEDNV